MVMPIQLIFRFFQSKARILVWLYEQTQMKIEGNIIGFDEYMNVRDKFFYNLKVKPTSTLLIVSGFTKENFFIEIEVIAQK